MLCTILTLFITIIISLSIVDGKNKETTDQLQMLETMMQTESECDVYMGPSMIKEAEQQGFGLGLYTGIMLYEGQDINWDETIIPFYDSKTIDLHPPLREYLWPGNMIPEIAFVSSADRNALWFSPGLSAIAPCTNTNFNLRLSGPGAFAGKSHASSRSNVVEDESIPPRTSPQAGSYSYHHKLSYEAARNILPGEELVLECISNEEHEFDTPVHLSIAKYNSSDPSFVCLDNVESDTSTAVGGQGLFVNEESISKGERILSSPVVPIYRKELFGDGTGNTASSGYNPYQLLLNYCIGNPESDVLLLPYGPMFSYINHPPDGIKANAILKWHKADAQQVLSRRQQYHHPEELFEMSAEEVTSIHGKGLMIDVIALDNIAVGEEIYIDYSDVYRKAWDDHVKRWKPPEGASTYISADKWFNSQSEDGKHANKDYPENLISVCYYDNDAHLIRVDEKTNTIHTEWQDDDLPHECIRPCKVLKTYNDPDPGYEDELIYDVEMNHFEGADKFPFCKLDFEGRHIAHGVTYNGVLIVDKTYTTDMFLEHAFRHEIGVPDKDFYPKNWLRQKVRRRSAAATTTTSNEGHEFKRKVVGGVTSVKMRMKEELMESARSDL